MMNIRPILILSGVILLVLLGVHAGSGAVAADVWDDSVLQDSFSRVHAEMNSAEVGEILGPADEVIPGETDPAHVIFVWKERRFGFTYSTVIIKFKDDRVAIAIHTHGNIRNPAAYVRKIEQRSNRPTVRSRYFADPVIPGALLSEKKPWADLSSILAKLDESRASQNPIEPDTVALFDSITPENELDSTMRHGDASRTSVTEGSTVTYTWRLGTARVTATYKQGALTGKRLNTEDLEIVVRERYWKAKNLRSGLTVTEYL